MNFLDSLMSPLSKNHCLLFYLVGLFSLAMAVPALIGLLMGLFRKNSSYVMGAYFMSFITNIILYYISRINYSVCLGALR